MIEWDFPKQIGKHGMALLVAGLFYLAGVIFIVTGLYSRHAAEVSIGATLVSVGSVWIVIGARYKKKIDRTAARQQR